MTPFTAEFVGTAILMVLGNGVVANVVLNKAKGNSSGWIVITFGWAIAVFVAVYSVAKFSGAHLNPAVTIADALNSGNWSKVSTYIPAQFLGAMAGAVLVWVAYKQHFDETADAGAKLACFSTGPAIKNPVFNFITEAIATCIFILCILMITNNEKSVQLGALEALPVSLLVFGIGLSLGGPTGYAINPARDLGPRIVHAILPIKGKGSSDWAYSWIPVLAPVAGAILAVLLHNLLTK